MAKKCQKSIYLEQDILNYILDYQKTNQLSSLSVALERIIFSIMMDKPIDTKKMQPSIIKSESKKEIPNSIKNIRNSMRE